VIEPGALIGSWQLLRCEAPLEFQPGTRMEFVDGGVLRYAIPTPQGTLDVAMRWRVDGGTLLTTHEDGSNAVAVGVDRSEADVLTFDFGEPRAWFVRVVP
jgi:hypothetical protein